MTKRVGLGCSGAAIAVMAGVLELVAAIPAYAHVDPLVPVPGASVARPTTVPPYGQTHVVTSTATGGATSWLPLVVVGAALLGVALVLAASVVLQRGRVAGRRAPRTLVRDDALEAALRQILAEASLDETGRVPASIPVATLR